jgi:hypothetical protein
MLFHLRQICGNEESDKIKNLAAHPEKVDFARFLLRPEEDSNLRPTV